MLSKYEREQKYKEAQELITELRKDEREFSDNPVVIIRLNDSSDFLEKARQTQLGNGR